MLLQPKTQCMKAHQMWFARIPLCTIRAEYRWNSIPFFPLGTKRHRSVVLCGHISRRVFRWKAADGRLARRPFPPLAFGPVLYAIGSVPDGGVAPPSPGRPSVRNKISTCPSPAMSASARVIASRNASEKHVPADGRCSIFASLSFLRSAIPSSMGSRERQHRASS